MVSVLCERLGPYDIMLLFVIAVASPESQVTLKNVDNIDNTENIEIWGPAWGKKCSFSYQNL